MHGAYNFKQCYDLNMKLEHLSFH
jgi:hypothetical protein